MNVEQEHCIDGRSVEQVDGIFEQIMVKSDLKIVNLCIKEIYQSPSSINKVFQNTL